MPQEESVSESQDVPAEIKKTMSSYQILMEGLCEVRVENKDSQQVLVLTELLRDLYSKHYEVVKILADFLEQVKKSKPEP